MFEHFTEGARKAVILAQEAARELDQPMINTQHLLLGLIRLEDKLLGELFGSVGLTEEALRGSTLFGNIPDQHAPAGHIPYATATMEAFKNAQQVAQELGTNIVQPEYLLVGLLRQEDSLAALELDDYGLTHRLAGARQRQ